MAVRIALVAFATVCCRWVWIWGGVPHGVAFRVWGGGGCGGRFAGLSSLGLGARLAGFGLCGAAFRVCALLCDSWGTVLLCADGVGGVLI